MASMVDVESPESFYHRRIDRGPEKDEFRRLPLQDKKLVSHLRSVMGVARDKVTQLRDEIDDKDRDISREVALRKAAETRLDQMVDMYADPSVNEELRRRLPRANKEDARKKLEKDLEQMQKQQANNQFSSPHRRLDRLAEEVEDDILTPEGARGRSRSAENSRRGRRRTPGGDTGYDSDGGLDGSRARSHSPPAAHRHHPYHHPGYFPGYPPPPGALYGYPGYYPPPPMYGYPSPVPGMQVAPGSVAPGSADMSVPGVATTPGKMMPGSLMQYGMSPIAQSTPLPPGVTPLPPGVSVMQYPTTMAYGTMLHNGGSPTNHNTGAGVATANQGTETGLVGGAASVGESGASSTGLSPTGGATSGADARQANVQKEQNRQIALLLAELDSARQQNKELQDKLSSVEREFESFKIAEETREASQKVEISRKAAALVEEIYRAQKTRDQAVMGRLKNANEERDEALLKLKAIQTEGMEPEVELDKNLQEMLRGIETDSAQNLGQYGNVLAEAIRKNQQQRNNITTEEMRAILKERDHAVNKCKQMEGEMLKLQRMNRVRNSDKEQQSTTQAKLLATQQERDMALARVRKLEEELQTLRVYYSLHKSLSQEANLRDQFNNTLENIEGELKERDDTINLANKENNKLLAQMKSLIVDKHTLKDDLEKSQAAHKLAQDNCDKLERLVNVLRRKINGMSSKMED